MEAPLLAAFSVGLAGAGHCLGMCGGIAVALGLGNTSGYGMTFAYHAGRLSSYAVLGAAAGLAAGSVDTAGWTLFLRYLAGALLLAMGLYIADWWRGLIWLERLGARLWQPVQGLVRHWLPPRRPQQALVLGLCWGLMPCGLIYSALALAATRQEPLASGLMMLSFGVGTLPAMLAGTLGAARLQRALRGRPLKLAIAMLLVASGSWTLFITANHDEHLLRASAEPEASHHRAH